MARLGRPERILTDNGAVFTGRYRGRGWVALERELALGIGLSHSRPYHPQTCGKVERFHQTLKKWLAARTPPPPSPSCKPSSTPSPATTTPSGRTAPSAAAPPQPPGTARPRAIPSRQGIRVDEQFRVRRDRVDNDGKLTLRHNSRLHHIGVGRRAGTQVLMLVRDLDIRIITEHDGELVRELTLDPTRDYQPRPPGCEL